MLSRRVLLAFAGLCLCVGLAGGSLIAAANDAPVTADGGTVSGNPGQTVTVTVSIENTGSSELFGLSFQLTGLPEGLSVVDTGGAGAYSSREQSFVYLSIAPGERITSTVTLRIDGCVARGSYQVDGIVADNKNQTVTTAASTVEVGSRESDSRRGRDGQRNCVVDPTAPESFPRDCVTADRPAIVYTDEQIGVAAVPQSDRDTPIGQGETRFVGISGPATGDVQTVSTASDVSFSSFEIGGYSTDDTGANASAEIIVRDPRITDLVLYTQPDRDGVEVSDGRVIQGSTVYLSSRYNFDEADRLRITVRDSAGLDVTDEVLGEGSDRFLLASEEDTALNFPDGQTGEYTITTEGSTICPTAATTATVTDDGFSVTAPDSTTRGSKTTVNISGQPGRAAHIRIPADRVASNEETLTTAAQSVTARQLFTRSSDIESRRYNASTDSYVATIDRLDGDGQARVQLRTEQLETGTLPVEAAPGTDPTDPAVDTADIDVREAAFRLDEVPVTVQARGEFAVSGRAERGEDFRAYARAGDVWYRVPLADDQNDRQNGQYQLNLSATGPLAIPGDYAVAVGRDVIVDGERFPQTVSSTEWRQLDHSNATILRITPPALQVSVRNPVLAHETADESIVQGQTAAETVRIYRVTPRGTVRQTSVEVSDNRFNHNIDTAARGTHRLVIVAPGRDGRFATTGTPPVPSGASPQQAVTALTSYHTRAERDDIVQTRTLTVTQPSLRVDTAYTSQQLEIAGATNRANGTTVFISVRNASQKRLLLTNTTVTDGAFNITVPVAQLETQPQELIVVVTVGDLSRRLSQTQATPVPATEGSPTPSLPPTTTAEPLQPPGNTATTTDSAIAAQPTNSTASPADDTTADATAAEPTNRARTRGDGPGYTVTIGMAALILATLVAVIRRE